MIPIDGNAVLNEPWTTTCALFVMPGGADLGYCRTLNGQGNRRITQFVERGGCYLGFCAGAYYGSGRCEFEVGNKNLEVVGRRELAFFPGVCRGLAFPGFVYNSERGAKAVELKVVKPSFGKGSPPDHFRSYYNGGGVFVDAPIFRHEGVQILAEYTQPLRVDSGKGTAAAVYCKVGDGGVVLSCTHPEYVCEPICLIRILTIPRFAAANLDHHSKVPEYGKLVHALTEDDTKRTDFVKAFLMKLGLDVNQENSTVPSLSRLHLSSASSLATAEVIKSLKEIIIVEGVEEYIKCENDTFHLQKPSAWSLEGVAEALPREITSMADQGQPTHNRFLDYNKITKQLIIHHDEPPASKETPYFNHDSFYANVRHFHGITELDEGTFGRNVLYGEVVTSTNTMLEK